MSVNDIRFRSADALVVLQVNVSEPDHYGRYSANTKWRDATMEDLMDVAACLRSKYTRIEYRQIMHVPPEMLPKDDGTC